MKNIGKISFTPFSKNVSVTEPIFTKLVLNGTMWRTPTPNFIQTGHEYAI